MPGSTPAMRCERGGAMKTEGWIIMMLSVSMVLTLVGYCLYRVLTLPPVEVEEHLHGPPTIDTGDARNPD